jgi:hypothetical protein
MTREDLKRAWKYLKGDGCTAVPDLTYSKCCRAHDADYRYAVNEEGEPLTRAEADKRLRECMMKTGKTPVIGRFLLPWVFWLGVRAGGGGIWNGHRDKEGKNG